MAKKKKKEPKEVFKPPEFDEVEFMKTEMDNAKAAIVTILYAIPIAIVSFLLTISGIAALGFVVGIIAIFMLKYVYTWLKINTESFERKTWIGNGALMFFTWLLFWILILNPPFSDSADPTIAHVEVWVEDTSGNWDSKELQFSNGQYITKDVIAVGSNIKLKANITDNSGIDGVTVTVTGGPPTGESMRRNYTCYDPCDYNYEYDYTITAFNEFTIRATDKNDNVSEIKVTIKT